MTEFELDEHGETSMIIEVSDENGSVARYDHNNLARFYMDEGYVGWRYPVGDLAG